MGPDGSMMSNGIDENDCKKTLSTTDDKNLTICGLQGGMARIFNAGTASPYVSIHILEGK